MRSFYHARASLLLGAAVLFAMFDSPLQSADAPDSLRASAWNITATPGVAELAAKFPIKENDAQMRFEHLASSPAGEWAKLDLKTGSVPLKVETREGRVSVLLPNGERCFISADQKTDYQLTFSSADAGVAKNVPKTAGSVLLLGSPQNNANDAQIVLITLPSSREEKQP